MKRLIAPIIVFVTFTALAWWLLHPAHVFEFDPDEGRNLAKALLLLRGHSLYSQVWSDQPPLMTWMLAALFSLKGFSVESARLMVLVLTASAVTLFFSSLRKRFGIVPALLGTLVLAFSFSFLRLSVSIMIGLVSIDFFIFSLWAFDCACWQERGKEKRAWGIVSGILAACSVLTKLITAPWIALVIAGMFFTRRIRFLFYWSVGFLSVLLPFAFVFQEFFQTQMFTPHLQAFGNDNASPLKALEFFGKDLPFVLLALIAIFTAKFRGDNAAKLAGVWLLSSITALMVIRPFQYHYYPIAALSIAWLSAYTINAVIEWRNETRQGKKYFSLDTNALLASIPLALFIFGLAIGVSRNVSVGNSLRTAYSKSNFAILSKLREYGKTNPWVFTDRPMYALRVGLLVPPEIAVLSHKRLDTQFGARALPAELLNSVVSKYSSPQVLLARFAYTEGFGQLLHQNYLSSLDQVQGKGRIRHFIARPEIRCAQPSLPTDPRSGAVVINSSEFLNHIPSDPIWADGEKFKESGLYGNEAIELHSDESLRVGVPIGKAGKYFIFVRSRNSEQASYQLSIAGQSIEVPVTHGAMALRPGGELFLSEGCAELRISKLTPNILLDAIILSPHPSFEEADLKKIQLQYEGIATQDYQIPKGRKVAFGQFDQAVGVGFAAFADDYSVQAFMPDGREIWRWWAPVERAAHRAPFEPPAVIWDFDGDGRGELAHWRLIDGKDSLVISDILTGDIKKKIAWPGLTGSHKYFNLRLAISQSRMREGHNLLVLTDHGGEILLTALDDDLHQLWEHRDSFDKDGGGHYIHEADVNGDGRDEIFISHLALDSSGSVQWQIPFQYGFYGDHMDNLRIVNFRSQQVLFTAQGPLGVSAYSALTGERLWNAEGDHAQKLEVGRFLTGEGDQIALNARAYTTFSDGSKEIEARLRWFSLDGKELLTAWPPNPIVSNPNFVIGDWCNTGEKQLFWERFKIGGDGKGTQYFEDPVFHMFDFDGDGSEEIVTLNEDRMKIFKCTKAIGGEDRTKDPEYLRTKVVNHSHYK